MNLNLQAQSRGHYSTVLGARHDFGPAVGQQEAETVIVGGGLAGLNTAISLTERKYIDICLLEAQQLGFGASGRNGGFVFAGYSLDEDALLKKLGRVPARALYQRSVDAVDSIRQRIGRYGIDCELVDAGVIWANWFRNPRILEKRQRLLRDHFGSEWQWLPQSELRRKLATERYTDALFEPNAMHINPLKYLLGLARAASGQGARIFEHSPVMGIRRDGGRWQVQTPQATLRCRSLVLACGGYLSGLVPEIDRSILPIATYAMATEPLGKHAAELIDTRAAIYDTRFAFDYYRVLPDTRLLWGGRISIRDRSPQDVAKLLRRDLARVYPQLANVEVAEAWSGLMSYARHQMPQIGTRGDSLYWAQAFGGHGLAPTTVAGAVLAQALTGDSSGLQDFAPFGLVESFRPAGLLAAQVNYTCLQALDWSRSVLER